MLRTKVNGKLRMGLFLEDVVGDPVGVDPWDPGLDPCFGKEYMTQ